MFASWLLLFYNENMSHTLTAIKYKPLAYWPLDGNLTDQSGYSRTASSTTTPDARVGLAYGALHSYLLSNTNQATFVSPVYNVGMESQPFSLSSIVRPIPATGKLQILSSNTRYDGLSIDGTVVSFAITFAAEGECRVEYDLGQARRVHLVGIYNVNNILLYVDGQLVGQEEISEEQKNDNFASGDNSLHMALSNNSRSLAVNGVGIFGQALDSSAILDLYASSTKTYQTNNVPVMYGGIVYNVAQQQNDIYFTAIWNFDNWTDGVLNNVTTDDGYLIPVVNNGVLQTGNWKHSVSIDGGLTSIYGVVPDWDGEGVTVESSLDGTSWETLTRGKNLTSITSGYNPAGKVLQVRVTFTDVEGYLKSLSFTGFKTGIVVYTNGRTLTITSAYPNYDQPVNTLDDLWGTKLVSGTMTLSSGGLTAGTYELWVQPQGAFTILPSGTTYVNGAAALVSTIAIGQWALVHVTNTVSSANLVISGDVRVGRVAFYPTLFDATTILNVYKSYVGNNISRADDVSVISVTEPAASVDIYGYDWTVMAASG